MISTVNKIAKRVIRRCAVCGKDAKIILYVGGKYRGGHYFGKIPLHTKKAWREAERAGTHKVKMGKSLWEVLNKNPKPYKHIEYWECPKCYWKK